MTRTQFKAILELRGWSANKRATYLQRLGGMAFSVAAALTDLTYEEMVEALGFEAVLSQDFNREERVIVMAARC